jgi:Protein of unknown function (DUF3995)
VATLTSSIKDPKIVDGWPMCNTLTLIVCLAFLILGLWHFYMAIAPARRGSAALPSLNGKALFVPSVPATMGVGVVLLLFAVLVAATGGYISLAVPKFVLIGSSYLLALALVARAIGEFKYVGFFKRIRGSRFARMDTFLYSPLCLLLAIGVALVALQNAT